MDRSFLCSTVKLISPFLIILLGGELVQAQNVNGRVSETALAGDQLQNIVKNHVDAKSGNLYVQRRMKMVALSNEEEKLKKIQSSQGDGSDAAKSTLNIIKQLTDEIKGIDSYIKILLVEREEFKRLNSLKGGSSGGPGSDDWVNPNSIKVLDSLLGPEDSGSPVNFR